MMETQLVLMDVLLLVQVKLDLFALFLELLDQDLLFTHNATKLALIMLNTLVFSNATMLQEDSLQNL